MAEVNTSVVKALAILDLLGQAGQGLRLTDIAAQVGLPASTTHRLLASLAAKGYVQQRPPADLYTVGWKIATLARSLTGELRLVADLRPYLERLLRQVRQTVNLAVLHDTQVMYVESMVPTQLLSLYTAPGALVPAHATSLGKALLAALPPADLEILLPRLTLEAHTPRTITALPALQAALSAVRARGYAIDLGEFVPDVNCLAAAIHDSGGQPVAAISVTARAAELPPDWVERFGPLVHQVATVAGHELFVGAVPIVADQAG